MPLIDANVFLEVELGQARSKECSSLLRRLSRGELEAYTTDFIIDTIAITMERNRCSAKSVRSFLLSIFRYRGLRVVTLSLVDKVQATRHMETYKLDFDDATTFQAMKTVKASEIVSYDHDFDKVPDIKRVEPSELR